MILGAFDGVLYNLVVDGNWIIKNSAVSSYTGKTQKYFIELDK
ncbi:MAG: hypothetical protein R2883_04895 [Caldisericia bacterium]